MNAELTRYLLFALAGVIGALARLLVVNKGDILFPRPKYTYVDGERKLRGLNVGFIGYLIVGCAAGLVVDQSVPTAFIGGVAAHALVKQWAQHKLEGKNGVIDHESNK